MSLKNGFDEVTAALVDIFLFSWVHDVVEPKYFFLIIFSLDIDGSWVCLYDTINILRVFLPYLVLYRSRSLL
jgi:hypothetical protein